MPKRKKNQKQLQKIRYRTVYNAWADSKLASRARGWSNDRIEKELGVKIPNKMPKKKRFKENTKRNKKRQFKHFVEVKQYTKDNTNVSVKDVYKLSRKGFSVETILDRLEDTVKSRKFINQTKQTGKLKFAEREARKRQWRKWSNDYMPIELIKLARKVNKMYNVEPDSSVGWVVVYNAYIHNESIDIWLEKVKFTDIREALYTKAVKVG